MEETTETREAGKQAEDQAVFARVWKRVMAGEAAEGPISLAPRDETEDGDPTPEAPAEAGALIPAGPAAVQDAPQGDFPKESGVLGEACRESLPLLQELTRRALRDWRVYQMLARRAGGGAGRSLGSLANQAHQNSKALTAAGFLISGVRYWPEDHTPPQLGSYLGALRQQFIREQETMTACLTGAEATADPCLGQMLWEQARSAWDRACRLRGLVEQV